MKWIQVLTLSLLLFAGNSVYAQNEKTNTEKSSSSVFSKSSLEDQFQYMLNKSSKYQSYKVVPQEWLSKYHKNLTDSIREVAENEKSLHETIQKQKLANEELTSTVSSLKSELETINTEKDSLLFMDMQMSKSAYNSFVWTIITVLIILSISLFLLFKRSHSVTSTTKKDLDEVKIEFEQHRRTALEREQKLARKLHTELHKNR